MRQLSNAWVALEAARAHTPLTLIGTTVLHQSHWSWSWASCTRCTHVSTITTWPTWNATRVPQPSGRQRRGNNVGTRQNLAANAAKGAPTSGRAHPTATDTHMVLAALMAEQGHAMKITAPTVSLRRQRVAALAGDEHTGRIVSAGASGWSQLVQEQELLEQGVAQGCVGQRRGREDSTVRVAESLRLAVCEGQGWLVTPVERVHARWLCKRRLLVMRGRHRGLYGCWWRTARGGG